jgi:AbrB family looped-hinge helix DNA binding protein
VQRTRLSSKGQIILPKGIRDERAWAPGTEFTVEATENGVLLRPVGLFPPTKIDDVAGCLRSTSKSVSPAQVQLAIDKQVKRRHDRGRY